MKTLLGIILALAAFMVGVVHGGCGDDEWKERFGCSTGQAHRVNNDLICYAHNGGAFAIRPWEMGDNATTACAFCDGTGTNNDGGQSQ